MEKFIFSKDLKTDVSSIDFQHQILIEKINILTESVEIADNEKVLINLKDLVRFTKQHFMYEEMIFNNFNYKQTKAHHTRHIGLTNELDDLIKTLEDGNPINYNEIYSFLKNWLTNHIKIEDMSYLDFMRENKVP